MRLEPRIEFRWRDQFWPHSIPTPPSNTTTRPCRRKAPRPPTSAQCAAPSRGGKAADANERSENNFCSMEITQEAREFAARQNAGVESFVAAEEAEAGMADMSRVFRETGSELCMVAGGREHD